MANNLVPSGSPTFAAGKFGNALTATNGYYTTNASFGAASATGTIEGWVKTTSTNNMMFFANNSTNIYVGQISNVVTFGYQGNANYQSSTSINNGNWHHIAAIYTGTNVMLYVDGTQVGSVASTAMLNLSSGYTSIGQNGNDNGYTWVGQIDEVRVSTSIRYTGSTYTVPSTAFTNDASTVALYHLESDGTDSAIITGGTGGPTTVSGLTHRLRASKLGLADGSLVSAAAFETGGITLSQGNVINQPKYAASSINGVAGIRFNGSSSWLSGNNPTVLNQPFSVTLVFRFATFDQYTNQQVFYSSGIDFGVNYVYGNFYSMNVGGSTMYGGQPTAGAHAVTITCSPGNVTALYVDGRLVSNTGVGAAVLADMRFGLYTDNSRGFNGDLCEIITYNKVLSASERMTVNTYIQNTYGIQMADVIGSDAVNGMSGLVHRFRAQKLTGYLHNTQIVSAAFEVGGITMGQTTDGNRPVFLTNSVGTLAGLNFNGYNYWMDGAVASAINQAFTMTTIFRVSNVSDIQEIVNASGIVMFINNSPANTYAFYGGSTISGGNTSTGVHALTAVVSGSNASLYLDGALIASGSVGGGGITSYTFGRNPFLNRYFNGDLNELIVYNRALSSTELTTLDGYIQSTYGFKLDDVPSTVIATENWTGANGAPWPSQWTGVATRTGSVQGSATIQSNAGAIVGGSSDSTYKEFLSGMPAVDNVDLVISFMIQVQDDHRIGIGINSDNTTAADNVSALNPTNGYWLYITTSSAAASTGLAIYKNTAKQGREDLSGSATVTTTAGTFYSVRIQRYGTRIRVKYWTASSAEPGAWQISVTDSTAATNAMPAGRVFLSVVNNYSQAQPVLFDNMTVSSPGGTAANTSVGRYVRSLDIPSLVITASGIQASSLQTANYSLLTTDAGRVVEINATTPTTVTIPPNASVAFPVGTFIDVCQIGTGVTNIVAGSGVTLDISMGTATYGRYSTIRLRQRAVNEWVITGAVTPFYDPTTITGLVYRMRASTIGISTDGTAVASMPFEVGGLTLTQGTAANQPIWRARGRNGKPYVNFDGVDDNIFVNSGVPTYNQPVTICVAAQINNGLSSQELIKAGGIEILLNQSTNTWSTYAGSLINSPVVYSGVQYFTGVFGAAGSQGSIQNYTNGTLTASGGGGGNSTGGGDLYIGTHPSTARYLAADVYEVLVYSATLTAADLTKLHAYMQATYL